MSQTLTDLHSGRTSGAVHAFDTGRLTANGTFLRGASLGSLLRRPEPMEFPVLAYVIEHPEGLIAVDTGLAADVTAPRRLRGFPPAPVAVDPLGEQLRARGLDPADVRVVVLTHLDWDHTGGLAAFPQARVLVHAPEWAFAHTRAGAMRYRSGMWPDGFAPQTYELDPVPFGPFPASRALTADGDVRVVPVPGHSPGQVAVAYDTGDRLLLFAADHLLRADWFTEDLARGRLVMLGPFARRDARETSRRLAALLRSRPTVLLPAHDEDAPRRLAALEPTAVH